MDTFYVYVLQSVVNKHFYVGHTKHILERWEEHNRGKSKFTKKFLPYRLVYFETFSSRPLAVKREIFFKSGKGREWLKEKLKQLGK